MNNILRIMKESTKTYMVLGIVALLILFSRIISAMITNTSSIGAILFDSALYFIFTAIALIGISLLTNIQTALVFAYDRQLLIKDLMKYLFALSFFGSLFINLFAFLLHHFPRSPLAPMSFGLNFNIFDGIIFRIFLLMFIMFPIGLLGLWLSSQFSVNGMIPGLTALIFTCTVLLACMRSIIEAYLWGDSLAFVGSILIGVTLLMSLNIRKTLLMCEVK